MIFRKSKYDDEGYVDEEGEDGVSSTREQISGGFAQHHEGESLASGSLAEDGLGLVESEDDDYNMNALKNEYTDDMMADENNIVQLDANDDSNNTSAIYNIDEDGENLLAEKALAYGGEDDDGFGITNMRASNGASSNLVYENNTAMNSSQQGHRNSGVSVGTKRRSGTGGINASSTGHKPNRVNRQKATSTKKSTKSNNTSVLSDSANQNEPIRRSSGSYGNTNYDLDESSPAVAGSSIWEDPAFENAENVSISNLMNDDSPASSARVGVNAYGASFPEDDLLLGGGAGVEISPTGGHLTLDPINTEQVEETAFNMDEVATNRNNPSQLFSLVGNEFNTGVHSSSGAGANMDTALESSPQSGTLANFGGHITPGNMTNNSTNNNTDVSFHLEQSDSSFLDEEDGFAAPRASNREGEHNADKSFSSDEMDGSYLSSPDKKGERARKEGDKFKDFLDNIGSPSDSKKSKSRSNVTGAHATASKDDQTFSMMLEDVLPKSSAAGKRNKDGKSTNSVPGVDASKKPTSTHAANVGGNDYSISENKKGSGSRDRSEESQKRQKEFDDLFSSNKEKKPLDLDDILSIGAVGVKDKEKDMLTTSTKRSSPRSNIDIDDLFSPSSKTSGSTTRAKLEKGVSFADEKDSRNNGTTTGAKKDESGNSSKTDGVGASNTTKPNVMSKVDDSAASKQSVPPHAKRVGQQQQQQTSISQQQAQVQSQRQSAAKAQQAQQQRASAVSEQQQTAASQFKSQTIYRKLTHHDMVLLSHLRVRLVESLRSLKLDPSVVYCLSCLAGEGSVFNYGGHGASDDYPSMQNEDGQGGEIGVHDFLQNYPAETLSHLMFPRRPYVDGPKLHPFEV